MAAMMPGWLRRWLPGVLPARTPDLASPPRLITPLVNQKKLTSGKGARSYSLLEKFPHVPTSSPHPPLLTASFSSPLICASQFIP